MSTHDLYEVLGIPRTATEDEIRAAFRRLAYLHPDRCPGDPTAVERFAKISGAYATLSDSAKRAKYDSFGPASAPVTETVELVNEIMRGAQTVDPARAALRVADKFATEQGRQEIRTFAQNLLGLLR